MLAGGVPDSNNFTTAARFASRFITTNNKTVKQKKYTYFIENFTGYKIG